MKGFSGEITINGKSNLFDQREAAPDFEGRAKAIDMVRDLYEKAMNIVGFSAESEVVDGALDCGGGAIEVRGEDEFVLLLFEVGPRSARVVVEELEYDSAANAVARLVGHIVEYSLIEML